MESSFCASIRTLGTRAQGVISGICPKAVHAWQGPLGLLEIYIHSHFRSVLLVHLVDVVAFAPNSHGFPHVVERSGEYHELQVLFTLRREAI